MREPDWVYKQRRQRAVAVVVMLIGAFIFVGVLGSTFSGGFDADLPVDLKDKTPRVAIDRPDTDQVLAREKRQKAEDRRRKTEDRKSKKSDRPRRSKPKPRAKATPAAPQ